MKIVPFDAMHVTLMQRPRPMLHPFTKGLTEAARNLKAAGPAYTLMGSDKPLGSGGIALMWEGVGSAWLYLDDRARDQKLRFRIARQCHEYLNQIMIMHDLHRVQAQVHQRFYAAQRFVEWLGFKSEGLAKGFGSDGEDWIHYAIIKKNN